MPEIGYVVMPIPDDDKWRPTGDEFYRLREDAKEAAKRAGGVLSDALPTPCSVTDLPDGFIGLRWEMTR